MLKLGRQDCEALEDYDNEISFLIRTTDHYCTALEVLFPISEDIV